MLRAAKRTTDDHFFTITQCERCGEPLHVRTCSWFNEQTIGEKCMEKEQQIKAALKARGEDPRTYEGCGYVPKI